MEYRYGLRSRPPSLGAVPRGLNFKWNSEFIDARMRVRYGVITCDRQLTKEEIYNFELVDMNRTKCGGNMISEYYEKTQNWDNESTTYWFKLTGIDYGTEMEFEGETYGIVESGCNDPFVVDSDNCSIPENDQLAIAVRNNVVITDEMRK